MKNIAYHLSDHFHDRLHPHGRPRNHISEPVQVLIRPVDFCFEIHLFDGVVSSSNGFAVVAGHRLVGRCVVL